MRTAATQRLSDRAHRQALQLRQNVAPKIDAIERSIIAPRSKALRCFEAVLGSELLGFRRRRRIVAGCAHRCDLSRPQQQSSPPSSAGIPQADRAGIVIRLILYSFERGLYAAPMRSPADSPLLKLYMYVMLVGVYL